MHKKFAILFMNIAKGKKDYVFRKTLKIYKIFIQEKYSKIFSENDLYNSLVKTKFSNQKKKSIYNTKKEKI